MTSDLNISIIIPSGRNDEILAALLRSLSHLLNNQNECIVILNPPRPTALFTEFPAVDFYSCESGSNRARTLGYLKSKGRWLWFIDDDCLFPKNIDLKLLADITSTAQVDAYAGAYLAPSNLTPTEKAYFTLSDCWQQLCFTSGFAFLLGGNCLIRKEFISETSWPQNISYGGAELALNIELSKNNARVLHEPRISLIHNIKIKNLNELSRKGAHQGTGSLQINSLGLKRQLTHPRISNTFKTHPLYLSSSEKEKLEIDNALELYVRAFKHSRLKLTRGSLKSTLTEKLKNLRNILRADQLRRTLP